MNDWKTIRFVEIDVGENINGLIENVNDVIVHFLEEDPKFDENEINIVVFNDQQLRIFHEEMLLMPLIYNKAEFNLENQPIFTQTKYEVRGIRILTSSYIDPKKAILTNEDGIKMFLDMVDSLIKRARKQERIELRIEIENMFSK